MPMTPDPVEGKRIHALDREYVFHSWSAQGPLNPLDIQGAEGCYVWDYDGNRYLDLSSQLVNINVGHQHPKVVKAIQDQAAVLTTIAPAHANAARGEAAQRIANLAPDGMNKVFFTGGGTDAVENAIRMARLHTGKQKVLSSYRSYHGNTGISIAATGDTRRFNNEYAQHHVHFFGPFLYRSAFWATTPEEESARALQHLEQVIIMEGPNSIAAVLLESVIGSSGIIPPPPGYLRGVRELCDKHGIVYIADEVMAGFGRTGEWFAFENYDAVPHLIAFAKGSNSGYVPVGGVIISDEIAATFKDRQFPGGLTYSGHPLAAASIVATLDVMHDEGIVDNAKSVGEKVLLPGLADLAERHPIVGDARGIGVFSALELVRDRATKEPLAPYGGASPEMGELGAELRKRGVLPLVIGNRLHVCPPCTISEDQVREGLSIVDEVLTLMDRHCTG